MAAETSLKQKFEMLPEKQLKQKKKKKEKRRLGSGSSGTVPA
jgi:hypothetical protein